MADATTYTSKLQGKRVLVIGGTSGIGFAVASAALEHGASVIVSSSNQSRIADALKRLQDAYPSKAAKVAGYACDLATEATLEASISGLLSQASSGGATKLDHVVYTAGDPLAIRPLADTSLEQMKQAGMVRFFGPLLLAKHLPNHMAAGPEASLTLTTGSIAKRPLPGWAVPGAYATGLVGIMQQLALDMAPLRVNCVAPGYVGTEMWDAMGGDAALRDVGKALPTGRAGRPQDVAEAYLYAMKDQFVTGEMLGTNGGVLLK